MFMILSYFYTSQQTYALMKTSWRCLEDVFRLRVQETSSRRLQNVLVKTIMFALVILFRKCLQDYLTNIFVLIMRLQDILQKHLQDIFKTSWRHFEDVFKMSCKDVFKTRSRRFQDVFKMYHYLKLFLLPPFHTSSRHIQRVFETYWEDDYLQKDLPRSHSWEIYSQGTSFLKSELFGYTRTFKTVFLKHFIKWLLLQIKIFLLKSSIRKNVATSVNKESMNKSSSKNVILRF